MVLAFIVTLTVIVVVALVAAAGYAIDRSVPDGAQEDGAGTQRPLAR